METVENRVLCVFRRYSSSFIYYPEFLKRAGWVVDVVCKRSHVVRHSTSVRNCHFATDEDVDFQGVTSQRLTTGEYSWLLIMDEPTRAAIYREPIDPVIVPYLPIDPTSELVAGFKDKMAFYDWCEAHHIPVPASKFITDASDVDHFTEKYGYPFVMKSCAGSGGDGFRVIQNNMEAYGAIEDMGSGSDRLLLQEYLTGRPGSVVMVAYKGVIGGWFAAEKTVSLLNGIGPTAIAKFEYDSRLGEIARAVALASGVTGITGFDYMRRVDGSFVVIDPHFGRCTPPGYLAPLVHIDFGAAMARLMSNEAVPIQNPEGTDQRVILFPQVIELLSQTGLTPLLQQWRLGAKIYWGPAREWRLSLAVTVHYVINLIKVLLGGWRRDRLHTIRRAMGNSGCVSLEMSGVKVCNDLPTQDYQRHHS